MLYDNSLASNPAGTGTFVRGLFQALKGRPDIEVIPASFDRVPEGGLDPSGKTLLRRGLNGLEHLRYYAAGLPRQAAAAGCDAIFCPSSLAPLRGRIPFLITVFDMTPFTFAGTQDWMSSRYQRFMLSRGAHRARAVCTISESVAREITDRFRDIPPQRVHVSPPGPNPELLTARPAAVGQLERPFLLMVGTLEPRKNHLTALRAFAEHRGRHPESDALLVLAGSSGWLYQPVTSAIRELGLDQHVVRLGTVDSGTLRWLYEHALALLFPSLYEGFGLPVLEAFALSCPVIASRIPAVIEVAGPKAATLLDPMDVGAWSSWIGRAIARQLDPGQIEAGRRRAQAFTWEGCATAVVGAIRTAIAPA